MIATGMNISLLNRCKTTTDICHIKIALYWFYAANKSSKVFLRDVCLGSHQDNVIESETHYFQLRTKDHCL